MFSGPESSSSVPAFVTKLWQMVNAPEYDDLICWCDTDTSFVIKDQSRFCSELLPMYYKHNNMSSFIRQLNKYGFRKVVSVNSASLKNEASEFEFCHPHFIKGYPVLLEQIKRKVSASKDIPELKTDNGLLTKLLVEVQQMQQKQAVFESRITAMKAENDALWREHSILRQKHQKQQKIVNRLIQFLLSLVHQTKNVNVKRRNAPLMLKDGTCLTIDHLTPSKERLYGSSSPIICEIDPDHVFSGQDTVVTDLLTSESSIPLISIPADKDCISVVMEKTNNTEAKDKKLVEDPLVLNKMDDPLVLNKIDDPLALNQKSSSKCNGNISKKKVTKNVAKRKLKSVPIADIVDNINVIDKLVKDGASSKSAPEKVPVADNYVNDTYYSRDDQKNILSSDPIIFSPLGTQIVSPNQEEEAEENTNTSLVLSDHNATVTKQDVENHIDLIQSDLDALKEVLHGEGLSLDASTIMGLFGGDDLISMNMPEVGRNNGNSSPVGKELVSYSNPGFMDITDCLDDDDILNADDTSLIDEISSTLNTPQQAPLTLDFSDSPPSKRLKSNFN